MLPPYLVRNELAGQLQVTSLGRICVPNSSQNGHIAMSPWFPGTKEQENE